MENKIKVVMWFVLVRLQNMRKWGGAHSELKRVLKSLPAHIYKDKKLIKKAVKELVKSDFVMLYKKTGELHTSLNPRKVKEINECLNKVKQSMKIKRVLFF